MLKPTRSCLLTRYLTALVFAGLVPALTVAADEAPPLFENPDVQRITVMLTDSFCYDNGASCENDGFPTATVEVSTVVQNEDDQSSLYFQGVGVEFDSDNIKVVISCLESSLIVQRSAVNLVEWLETEINAQLEGSLQTTLSKRKGRPGKGLLEITGTVLQSSLEKFDAATAKTDVEAVGGSCTTLSIHSALASL